MVVKINGDVFGFSIYQLLKEILKFYLLTSGSKWNNAFYYGRIQVCRNILADA
jgi:hypothetical protein